jgi:hypothetical protein
MINLTKLEYIRHELELQASMVDDHEARSVIHDNVYRLAAIIAQEQEERDSYLDNEAAQAAAVVSASEAKQHLEG